MINNKIIFLIIFLIICILIFDNISYMRDNVYKNAYDLGNNYLQKAKKSNFFKLQHPAVMFDIDDTLIDYGGNPIKEIIKLLNKCISMGLLVVIITARSEIFREDTIMELNKHHIRYGGLFLRSGTDDLNTFKSKIKQKLSEDSDVTMIMSIGDNMIDIDGAYSGYWIKLPNKYDPNLYHLNSRGISEQVV